MNIINEIENNNKFKQEFVEENDDCETVEDETEAYEEPVEETYYEETVEYDEPSNDYSELTSERVSIFLHEIKSNCEQILSELPYERRLNTETKEDIEYIVNTIINNCEAEDLNNTIALVTALDYIGQKAKNLKIYIKEMKNVAINLYCN